MFGETKYKKGSSNMNTECMYILEKEKQTLEDAKEFCKYLDELAARKYEEVYSTFISKALKDFKVTPDYDGYGRAFTVKKGTIFVWAYGKDYCMYRLYPIGARRGFPYALNKSLSGLFEDVIRCSDLYKEERK